MAGNFVRLACKRHLGDLKKTGKAWPYRWDPWHAGDICDFIEKLPHVEGQWDTPTISLEDPQIFILAVVFGWRRKVDGGRRFSSAYIEMARKGAKSTLTAGVALYCLACEGEPGPQVIIGATTGEQAKKVFSPARLMAAKTPALCDAFGLKVWSKSITEPGGGFMQTINAKGATQDGWNPHLGVLDELHAHKDRALFDVIKSAFGARKNPLMWVITTAGANVHGVCYEERTKIVKILDGVFTDMDHVFGIIFTIDEGDDPYDPAVWIKANPMLGVTPTVASMAQYAAEAKASPAAEVDFKTKRLNVWVGAAGAWLNMHQWNTCADPSLSWDDFGGLDVYVGGDLADKDDITALVLSAFTPDDCLLVKPVFFLPDAVVHLGAGDGVKLSEAQLRYLRWHEQGHLRFTPGDWVDHNEVEAVVRGWRDRYGARAAVFDQFAAAQQMAARLNAEGDPDRPFAQILVKNAANVTDPAKDLEARVKVGPRKLRHDGNPVLTWMASNVVVTRGVNGTILPKKEHKDSPNKIDGIDALVNSTWPVVTHVEAERKITAAGIFGGVV